MFLNKILQEKHYLFLKVEKLNIVKLKIFKKKKTLMYIKMKIFKNSNFIKKNQKSSYFLV
jgi:hypothetical protein